jgi:hypothetical protein
MNTTPDKNCTRIYPPRSEKVWSRLLLALLLPLLLASNVQADAPKGTELKLDLAPAGVLSREWKPLLDAKLSNWELWMGAPYTVTTGPAGAQIVKDWVTEPALGLNNDPKHVFSMRTEDGEPVLHITGEIYGGLTTLRSYSNYHFRCQFKWGNQTWPPKLTAPRDNGILYDCTGPHGAFQKVWKRCVEFQVEDRNMGDLYCLAGTGADVPVRHGPHGLIYDPAGTVEKVNGKVAHLAGDFEVPVGQWNTLDLYTMGSTSIEVVNGHVVQVLRNIVAYVGPDKVPVPLTAGQIQLQSEGAEAEYRRVEIQSISDYPPEIKQAARLN